MKNLLKSVCVIFALLLLSSHIYGQNEQKIYLGFGTGFDYGGYGGKIEYLPIKSVGLFAGLGYNLLSAGYNVGATFKILPDKKISPNLMFMYGYNAVLKVNGASHYNMTSYGITIGANLDIETNGSGDKLSIGLFVPVRSEKFMDNYDSVKNNPNIEMKAELIPIALSIGYNFRMK